MNNAQISATMIAGLATTCAGAMITGYSLYKIINLSDEASVKKLDYDEANQIYWAGLGLMGGVASMYLGASLLSTGIATTQDLAYKRGVNDTMMAVKKGYLNPNPKRPQICGRFEWNKSKPQFVNNEHCCCSAPTSVATQPEQPANTIDSSGITTITF